jgi:hypothetical protein
MYLSVKANSVGLSINQAQSTTQELSMNKQLSIIILFLTSLLAGCAGTGGSHQLIGSPLDNSQASKFSDLLITVQPANNVSLSQSDTDRMSKLVAEDIMTNSPNRFKTINTASSSPTKLQALVSVKNYDKGSAFARAMLAGLGQIHIDADVILSNSSSKEKLARYEVTKTFAWGGLYGGFTGIKDAEVGFCKAVANSILGKD